MGRTGKNKRARKNKKKRLRKKKSHPGINNEILKRGSFGKTKKNKIKIEKRRIKTKIRIK